ncbi:MAG TPA: glycosyltransferase, partial [Burkholderiales bacterium]|nr:glycosyltransferase [Burkholderiales bacterium]
MNVLHVTPSFYPAFLYGGTTYSVHALCRGLVAAGCSVRVLTTNANGPDAVLDTPSDRDVELQPGLNVRYCRRIADVSVSPQLLRSLPAAIRSADVVHLTAVYSFPTIPTLFLSRWYRKPVVWSPRGMLQRWPETPRTALKAPWEQICRLVAPRNMVLHCTSEEEAAESTERMEGARAVVIPNGVEVP